MKIPDAVVSKDAELNTYAHLWHASRVFRKQAEEQVSGSYYQRMTSLIFAAFTVEAFCNHIGNFLFSDWKETERKQSPKDKLERICKQLGVPKDFGKRPYKTISGLLEFRNALAHGKSVKLTKEMVVPMDDKYEEVLQQELRAEWQEYITPENLNDVHEDVKLIVESIHTASKMDDQVFNLGLWGYRAVPKEQSDP